MNVASTGEACGDEEEQCVPSVILTTPRESGMALGKGKPKGHSHVLGEVKKPHQSGAFCKLKPRPLHPGAHRWTQDNKCWLILLPKYSGPTHHFRCVREELAMCQNSGLSMLPWFPGPKKTEVHP